MSWQSYISNLTDGVVESAAICGFASGAESVWASTTDLACIAKEEIRKMAHDRKDFPINGAYLGGRKCRFLRDQMDVEDFFLCTFKTAQAADGTTVNVCVGKTKQALVIAFAKKDVSGGPLNESVYKIVKYLRETGF
ncbi:profilin-2-like isoform X2 [Labrus mixtus]|uniref:profilin-2-like isoform X2 n=1 Tax=Labrus mixtus TaxID=508554 RepID=UPI0029C02EA5|nr:profilin-2-like isoform X2 [Labrus mixtus]